MKLVLSEKADKPGWDRWVAENGGTVFSLSRYLDATADHWGILCNEDQTGGMACAFSVKLGVRVLYAPFFHRYSEWIGAGRPSAETLTAALKQHFRVADAQLRWPEHLPDATKTHQEITAAQFAPNQQAKRMLKKAAHFEISAGFNPQPLLELLNTELSPRIQTINAHSLQLLARLVQTFSADELTQLNLLENRTWKGALWLVAFNGRLLYLKGTVTEDARKQGGMYALMERAQQEAFSRGLVFDFGGSNAEGVRRFNLNWGASDVAYRHLQWNNAPVWWKMLKQLRTLWNRQSF